MGIGGNRGMFAGKASWFWAMRTPIISMAGVRGRNLVLLQSQPLAYRYDQFVEWDHGVPNDTMASKGCESPVQRVA